MIYGTRVTYVQAGLCHVSLYGADVHAIYVFLPLVFFFLQR